MPVLNTPQEFLSALSANPFSTDPLADLKKQGHTLSPSLQKQMKSAIGSKKLARPPVGMTPANFKGKLSFEISPLPIVPAPPTPGTYDVVVGVHLDVANAYLAALHQSGTIPHRVALDLLLSPTDLTLLSSGFVVDRPGGSITQLHIISAPTLTATTDGSPVLALHIPIQIDWTRPGIGPVGHSFPVLVTKAVGSLQLTAQLTANVALSEVDSLSRMTISIKIVTDAETPATSPRLTLDPASPVQLKSQVPPDQLDGFAIIIQNALALQFQHQLTFPVSPILALPTGSLEIRQLDVLASGGVLLAGVNVVGTTGAGDPSTLTNLLPNQQLNVFSQVRDSVLNVLVNNALLSGQLTEAARASNENAVIDSASASFQNNAFVAHIHGRLVNQCPLNTDLAFGATRTVTVKLLNSSIEIDQKDDQGPDLGDSIWCLVTTLGLVAFAFVCGLLMGGVAAAITGGILGFALSNIGQFTLSQIFGGGGGGPQKTIIDLNQPVPGTDVLPFVNNGFMSISDGVALMAAAAATKADDINTVIYACFLVPSGLVATTPTPLAGAKVELMDQQVPTPAGDVDDSIQLPPDTSVNDQRISTQTTHSFIPPRFDDKLAEGITNLDGIVRFAILKGNLKATAGFIQTVTTRINHLTGTTTTTTTRAPALEDNPDLYFRITMPDGKLADTRALPGGLMLDFQSAQVGTLANPLNFTLGTTVVGLH
jgi:hypothetical protein